MSFPCVIMSVLFSEMRALPGAPAVNFSSLRLLWFLQPPILQRTCCEIAFMGALDSPEHLTHPYICTGIRGKVRMQRSAWTAWPHSSCFSRPATALSLEDFRVTLGLSTVQQLGAIYKAVYLHLQSPLILSTPTPPLQVSILHPH